MAENKTKSTDKRKETTKTKASAKADAFCFCCALSGNRMQRFAFLRSKMNQAFINVCFQKKFKTS